jgi:penicillin amidase
MDKDAAAPLITQYLGNELGRSLVALAGRRAGDADTLLPRPEIIEDLLRRHPAGWVPGNDWDTWLLHNFTAALEAGRKRHGSPISHWRWGNVLQWNIQHAVGKQLPFVNGYFDIGPFPMSGSGTTVKQTTATLGPSERMVVDVGDWDKSVQNLPTGESGNVASPHYKDEWSAYYVGQSFPMEFQYIDAKQTLHILPDAPSNKRQ